MKTIGLIYIDTNLTDDDLNFNNTFIPYYIKDLLLEIEEIDDVIFGIENSYSGIILENNNLQKYENFDSPELYRNIFDKTNADTIIKVFGDSPFLQKSLIMEMLKLHNDYNPEFTFSYNLPEGYGCQIISKDILNNPAFNLNNDGKLYDVINRNLNQFDVELFYKEPDIRWHRLQFRLKDKNDKKIMENIIEKYNKPDYEHIENILNNNPEVLFTFPYYIELELCGKCNLDCIFCYRKALKNEHGIMELSLINKLLTEMETFGNKYSICLGGSGEPLMHPEFLKIIKICNDNQNIENIIVETNGILLNTELATQLSLLDLNKIKFIFNIAGIDSDSYKSLHGFDYHETVTRNILQLKELIKSTQNIYVQIPKINETEPYLDRYYDFWEKENINIILQKHNTYLGKIQDRRYADLTPIVRRPCWHLRRDLYILYNGNVAFCKQDIDGANCRGSIVKDNIYEIWENQKKSFINDFKSNKEKNPDCNNCDEWYTYNL